MAGYIGKSQSITQVDGYNKAEADSKFVEGDDTLYVDEANNRVGIGTSSPSYDLEVARDSDPSIALHDIGNWTTVLRTYGSVGAFAIDNGGTERMRIDSAGRVTTPYQPLASVRLNFPAGNTSGVSTTNSVYLNAGNNWSSSTHRFTAPVSGYYELNASFYTNYTDSFGYYSFYKNGFYSLLYHYNNASGGAIHFPGSAQQIEYLNAGDYVQFGRPSSGGSSTFDVTYLSVRLVG